jgi:hypothetical protein
MISFPGSGGFLFEEKIDFRMKILDFRIKNTEVYAFLIFIIFKMFRIEIEIKMGVNPSN